MLDTFKARLKAKAKTLGANLSQKRIDEYSARLHKKNPDITEEKDHDEKIDELLEFVDIKEIAKNDDRLRTLESKNKGQDPDEPADDDDDDAAPAQTKPKKSVKKNDDEPPIWAQGLIADLAALKAEKSKATIAEKIKAHEKLKDIPAEFLEGRQLPDKEEDIETFVTGVETAFTKIKQKFIDDGTVTSAPILGSANKEGISTEVATYIQNKTATDKGASDLGGKKI